MRNCINNQFYLFFSAVEILENIQKVTKLMNDSTAQRHEHKPLRLHNLQNIKMKKKNYRKLKRRKLANERKEKVHTNQANNVHSALVWLCRSMHKEPNNHAKSGGTNGIHTTKKKRKRNQK